MNELTKLDVFAMRAMQAIISNDDLLQSFEDDSVNEDIHDVISKVAYNFAEAMLAESEKRNKTDKPKREIPEIDKTI